jgi:hypothetical protein
LRPLIPDLRRSTTVARRPLRHSASSGTPVQVPDCTPR